MKESSSEEKIFSLGEALKREPHDLEVPENKRIYLSHQESDYADYTAQVHIRKFKDLQVLGFAPRELSEDKIFDAILNDNEESYKIANSIDNSTNDVCSCNTNKKSETNFEGRYNNTRKRSNFSLSKLYSQYYDRPILPDDPATNKIRNLVSKLKHGGMLTSIVITKDIKIERNGILEIDPVTPFLFARDISIHRTGSLVDKGRSLNIYANSINTFIDWKQAVTMREDPFWVDMYKGN